VEIICKASVCFGCKSTKGVLASTDFDGDPVSLSHEELFGDVLLIYRKFFAGVL
jgi:hypothetical protein